MRWQVSLKAMAQVREGCVIREIRRVTFSNQVLGSYHYCLLLLNGWLERFRIWMQEITYLWIVDFPWRMDWVDHYWYNKLFSSIFFPWQRIWVGWQWVRCWIVGQMLLGRVVNNNRVLMKQGINCIGSHGPSLEAQQRGWMMKTNASWGWSLCVWFFGGKIS